MVDFKFSELWEMAEHDLQENIGTWNDFFEEWHIEKTPARKKERMRGFISAFGDVVAIYDGDIGQAEKDMLDYFDYYYEKCTSNK